MNLRAFSLLFLAFALLLNAITFSFVARDLYHHRDAFPVSNPKFDEQFQRDNDGYFDGQLWPTIVSYIDEPNADLGDTNCDTIHHDCSIFVNAYYDRDFREARMTLFHEECHVAILGKGIEPFDPHGPPWQTCMHNLANAGAFENLW